MRVAAVVVAVGLAASATGVAHAGGVTRDIPADLAATLAGCWRVDAAETWTFHRDAAAGSHGMTVVRELADAAYADRARVPEAVLFDPGAHDFAFGAAGRIHGLMMVFRIAAGSPRALAADVYTSHDGKSYMYTGNSVTLHRCAR